MTDRTRPAPIETPIETIAAALSLIALLVVVIITGTLLMANAAASDRAAQQARAQPVCYGSGPAKTCE